ncbi:MAG TPA: MFS transporter, partial [bacterium]
MTAAPAYDLPRAPVLVLAWLVGVNLRAPLTAAGPLLPLIMQDLHLSATVAGAVTALPFLVIAVLSIPGGMLGDAIGSRRTVIGGLLAIGIVGAARALAGTPLGLLALLVLLGAAVGLVQPTLGTIAHASPAGPIVTTAVYTNGLNVGVLAASALSVPVLLPLLGGTWRGVVTGWGIFAVATAALSAVFMPRIAPRREAAPLLLPAESGPWTGRSLVSLVAIFAAQAAAFNGLLTWLPSYLVAHGFSLEYGSLALSAMSVCSIASAMIVPRLAGSPPHRRRPFYVSSVLLVAGLTALLARPQSAVVWAGIVGFGIGFSFTYALAVPAELAPPGRVGATIGLVFSLGYV